MYGHQHPMFEFLPEQTKRQLDPDYRNQQERREMEHYLHNLQPLMHQMVHVLSGTPLAEEARSVFAQVPEAHRPTLNRLLNHAREDGSLRYEEYGAFGHAGNNNDSPFVMGAAAILIYARKAHKLEIHPEGIQQPWSALVIQAAEVCRGEYANLSRLLSMCAGTVRFREEG